MPRDPRTNAPAWSPSAPAAHAVDLWVAVVGDALLDVYRHAETVGTCREAPVPKTRLIATSAAPGGAANVAANAAALGARTRLVTALGDDADGAVLADLLAAAGVDAAAGEAVVPGRATCVKERIVADGRLLARVDRGDGGPPPGRARARLLERIRDAAAWADVVVVADYEHGVLNEAARDVLAGGGPDQVRVVDSARLGFWRSLAPDLVTPNAREALDLLGGEGGRAGGEPAERLARRAPWLVGACGARAVAVTLDRDGALVMLPGAAPVPVATEPVEGAPAIGAGDVVTAVAAVALGLGAGPVAAVEVACRAAARAVARPGTAVVRAADLDAGLPGPALRSHDEIARAGRRMRAEGRRVVLTNGCFDLLHPGHVDVLERARALGDALVVAINDDPGVRRLKGHGRPVMRLHERLRVLGALAAVDHVAVFSEDTACEVLRSLRPDVYAKGVRGDGVPPEADTARRLGAEVALLPASADGSTLEVLRRIGAPDA